MKTLLLLTVAFLAGFGTEYVISEKKLDENRQLVQSTERVKQMLREDADILAENAELVNTLERNLGRGIK